jgi:hypothetical protein
VVFSFSPGIPVSSTNKTDCHYITEILLKVVLNTITPLLSLSKTFEIKSGTKKGRPKEDIQVLK